MTSELPDDYGPEPPGQEFNEVEAFGRHPEIGPQEASWNDLEDAYWAAVNAGLDHGPTSAEAVAAERDHREVEAAYSRNCERGYARQEMEAEAGS